jgi:hypothetical protein
MGKDMRISKQLPTRILPVVSARRARHSRRESGGSKSDSTGLTALGRFGQISRDAAVSPNAKILLMPRNRARWIAGIATIRVFTFMGGRMLMARYGDWRQIVGYPLILIGALPDALFVGYVVQPRSSVWPLVMVVSLLASSMIFVAIVVRAKRVSGHQ